MPSKIIEMCLHEIVDHDNESILDAIVALWMAEYPAAQRGDLSCITYEAVGWNPMTALIQIAVTADEELPDEARA